MAQKRYFDYQSKIKSKTSAEAMALASAGIGVKYGFNKVSVSGNNTFIISSDNTITLTNSDNGTLDEVKHVVITPDGIIAAETEDIRLTLSDSSNLTEGSYFVLASHQHIESLDAIISTSYTLVKGDISLISELTKVDTTIDTWYSKLSTVYNQLNRNTTVIAALIEYHNAGDIKVYNPYHNKWPSDYLKLNNRIDNIDGIINKVILSLDLNGDNGDIEFKKLDNIIGISLFTGSGITPVIQGDVEIPNGSKQTYGAKLSIIKLNDSLFSIRGILNYGISISDIPESMEPVYLTTESIDSSDKNKRRIFNLGLKVNDTGFVLKNISDKLGITNLTILSCNVNVGGFDDYISSGFTKSVNIPFYVSPLVSITEDNNLDLRLYASLSNIDVQNFLDLLYGGDINKLSYYLDILLIKSA